MTLPVVFTANGPSGYNLTKSLRFRSSASAYLNRTPTTASNRTTWTWSGWVKLGALNPSSGWNAIFGAYSDDNNRTFFYTNNNSVSNAFYFFNVVGGTANCTLISTQVLRDVSAWYHIVVAVDTNQGTSTNRVKIYLNGSQITSFGTATYPSSSANFMVNNNVAHYIGASSFSGINLFHDGYMAEINAIDGQALTPSSFGETSTTTGVWIPKKYTGSYGTNGFYLPFTDTTSTSTLGTDFSGNSNTWTVNNISLTSGSTYDSMTDVPTLTSATTANYAVMNPLRPFGGSLSNGNLTAVTGNSGSANSGFVTSTVWLPTSGKFYFEATPTTVSDIAIGLTTDSNIRAAMYYRGGDIYINGSVTTSQASYTNNDVIGVAVDIGGATVQFYKNNAAQGTAQSISAITAPLVASLAQLSGSSSATAEVNFGQRPFAYTPPTNFVALNTFNLPTPTIGATAATTANKYMDVSLYTGTGALTQTATNSGSMQPDFVWIKDRSQSTRHVLTDSVRGVGKSLYSNTTDSEGTNDSTGYLSAFDSNGFTVNRGSGGLGERVNYSGDAYVGWQWRASNATAVTNTAGSITSTVSASTTAGFSIVSYTGNGSAGSTVGHGLGVAPKMIIAKKRSTGTSSQWTVGFSDLGWNKYILLNSTGASATDANVWNSTPTSSVFYLGNDVWNNQNGETIIAYCFAPIAGYSAFGSYTGNGSPDGTFVFTGFRPRFIMRKRTDTTAYWVVFDTARNTYNVVGEDLYPNDSLAGSNDFTMDILSNGFKIRGSGSNINASGGTYIYMAFCESPFKFSNAR